MKKLVAIFIISLGLFAQETKFSVISLGNFKGNYRDIDSLKIAIDVKDKEKLALYDNVIKVNIGNNMSEYPIKNELMETFIKNIGFNFNFLVKKNFFGKNFLK